MFVRALYVVPNTKRDINSVFGIFRYGSGFHIKIARTNLGYFQEEK